MDAEVAKVTNPDAVIESGGDELKKAGTGVQSPNDKGLSERIDEAIEVEYLKDSAGV